MRGLIRFLFFHGVVRPFVVLALGVNTRHRERIPTEGPVIFVANHNSHLDTFVLWSLLPWRLARTFHPVAAADYFLKTALSRWFFLSVMGIVPIHRDGRGGKDPLAPLEAVLEAGGLLLLFPEGTRGEPDVMEDMRAGIHHLAKRKPEVPVVPVFLHGCGMALPKGEALFVPTVVDLVVGEPATFESDRAGYLMHLKERLEALGEERAVPVP